MKRVSIKRDIYLYLFGLLLGLTGVYVLMINQSYEVGLNESAKYGFLYEMKLAEQQYLARGELPVSSSPSFRVFDDPDHVPSLFLKLFDWGKFEPGVIYDRYVTDESGRYGNYYYAAYYYVEARQRYLYVVSQYDEALYYQLYEQSPPESVSQANSAFLMIGALLLLVFILIRVLVHRLTKPMIQLSEWSQTLDLDQAETIKHFRYIEVQQLANQLVDSVEARQQAIEREAFFLRAASHELRTPVSIISASGEMLTRLSESMTRGGQRAVGRINRSVLTMQNLITSLLWMSRNQPLNIEIKSVDLHVVVQNVLASHGYLADDKPLEIEVTVASTSLSAPLPVVLVEIVVTNLVRNALQHAPGGKVAITVTADSVSITNAIDVAGHEGAEASFGIGLILIERLCQHQGWSFSHQSSQQQYLAEVTFTANSLAQAGN